MKTINKNRVSLTILAIVIAVCSLTYITGAKSSAADVRTELLACYFQNRTFDDLAPEEKERVDELMKSEYARMWDESIGSVAEAYHEKMNEKFNKYIEKAMSSASKAAIQPTGQDAINSRAPEAATTEAALKKCAENDYANYSTYCVAITLYADPSFGYKGFRDVMSCRKNELFESTKEKNAYIDGMVMGEKNEQEVYKIYQQEAILSISNKISQATNAVNDAKAALDQTLSAYDQMKLAWSLHTRYVKIYEDLVKYRDKLVDIRHYVETFPSKFIDASTTQCT